MAERCDEDFETLRLDKNDFDPGTLEDELRIDGLCKDLLLRFYEETCAQGVPAAEATALASSADYFIRDFVLSIKQMNIFSERPGIIRQFAGNWYIVNTLEPDAAEIERHLQGIRAFYRFLHGHGLISLHYLQTMERECDERDFYASRIDSFWDIQGDGYGEWERQCSLRDQPH
ncbi:hypothetical protein [Geotalea sp. SG265]|uniref:hypothetical protein n=1 Tax=Geotalea sp. SG265 TaxID=2922867 RepID=UPI001FAF464F|nr:hypothetical protein [Geotalea sp. SG265]